MINTFDFEDQTTDFENQFNCSSYKKKINNPLPLSFVIVANKEMKTDTMLELMMETKEVIIVKVLRLMMDI